MDTPSGNRKFAAMVWVTGTICALALVYNIASEYFLPDLEAYIARRVYFEQVISKKGLSMHKAKHWSAVKEE
jgi:hypothetical protein